MNLFPYTNFHELNLDWLLRKVREVIADQIAVTNDMNELKITVSNALSDLKVTEKVRDEINALKESGELESIIESAVISLAQIPHGQNELSLYPVSTETYSGTYTQVQGGCITPDGNLIYALIDPVGSREGNLDVKLVKKSISNMETIATATITNGGHYNSMDYNPADGYIYASKNPTIDSQGVSHPDNKYAVINPVNLTVVHDDVEIVNAAGSDVTFHAITFDDDGTMYILRGTNQLYKVHDNVATLYRTLNEPNPKPTYSQDITYHDGHFYHLYAVPNTMYIHTADGQFITGYNIPFHLANTFYGGESEFVTFNGEDGYIGLFSLESQIRDVSTIAVNKFNLLKNTFSGIMQTSTGVTSSLSRNIYVDASYDGSIETGSEEQPFTTLQKAFNSMQGGNIYNRYNIYIEAGEYPFAYINNIPGGVVLNGESGVEIGGLYIQSCASVKISNVVINPPADYYNYSLYISHSTVDMNTVTVHGAADQTYAIYSTYSEVWLYAIDVDTAPIGMGTNASNIHGNVRGYNSAPENRLYLGGQSVWHSGNPRGMTLAAVADIPFQTDKSSISVFPTAIRLKEKSEVFQIGTITLPNHSYANALLIELIFHGRTQNRIVMCKSTSTMGITETLTEVVSNVQYVGMMELYYNPANGNMTWKTNSNKEYHNGATTYYTGDNSEVDDNYIQIGNIYALSL